MRILAEGSTTMTGSAVTLCTGFTGVGVRVWVGAGDSNAAIVRIGVTTLELCLDITDKKGFEIQQSDPGALKANGTNGDVVRWVVWG